MEADTVEGGGHESDLDVDLVVGERCDVAGVGCASEMAGEGGEVAAVPLLDEGVRGVRWAGGLGRDGGEELEQARVPLVGGHDLGEPAEVVEAVDVGEVVLDSPAVPRGQDGGEQSLFAAEVLDQRGVGYPGLLRDGPYRAACVAVLSEDVPGPPRC